MGNAASEPVGSRRFPPAAGVCAKVRGSPQAVGGLGTRGRLDRSAEVEEIEVRGAQQRDDGKINGSDLTWAVQGAIFRSHERS